jgi:hypothetical protein
MLENLQFVLILRRLLLLFLLLHIPRVAHWFTRVDNITEILLKVALTLNQTYSSSIYLGNLFSQHFLTRHLMPKNGPNQILSFRRCFIGKSKQLAVL